MRLLTVPTGLQQRLELFQFKLQFGQLIEELEAKVSVVERAVNVLSSSKALKDVLQLILALGNYLNGGTAQGGAYGFKLSTLSKLKATKTVDNKSNLLAYIVNLYNTRNVTGIKFTEEASTRRSFPPSAHLSVG